MGFDVLKLSRLTDGRFEGDGKDGSDALLALRVQKSVHNNGYCCTFYWSCKPLHGVSMVILRLSRVTPEDVMVCTCCPAEGRRV